MRTNAKLDEFPNTILTIGHSTRPLADFLNLLTLHKIASIADVRTIPKSRHNPQFNRDDLRSSLAEQGIDYRHIAGLGGLRHPKKDSINAAWRNAGFRGFADYMQSEAFERELDKLIEVAETQRIALMCAEAVPWRCHRSLIADALVVRGIDVEHILNASRPSPHHLTPFAVVEGNHIVYTGQPSLELDVKK